MEMLYACACAQKGFVFAEPACWAASRVESLILDVSMRRRVPSGLIHTGCVVSCLRAQQSARLRHSLSHRRFCAHLKFRECLPCRCDAAQLEQEQSACVGGAEVHTAVHGPAAAVRLHRK